MGVDLYWMDSNARERDHVSDDANVLASVIDAAQSGKRDFPVLTSLQLYSQTILQGQRASSFADEISEIRAGEPDPAIRIQLGRFERVARAVESVPGSYLVFIGD